MVVNVKTTVETVTHASRTKFDELLNDKLEWYTEKHNGKVEIDYKPVVFNGEDEDYIVFTAMLTITYTEIDPGRNLPA